MSAMAVKKTTKRAKAVPVLGSGGISVSAIASSDEADAPTGGGNYQPGDMVTLSYPGESEDFAFVMWVGSDGSVYSSPTFTFEVGQEDVVFMAVCQSMKGSKLLIWKD